MSLATTLHHSTTTPQNLDELSIALVGVNDPCTVSLVQTYVNQKLAPLLLNAQSLGFVDGEMAVIACANSLTERA